MKDMIFRYIAFMQKKYNIEAAMVAGSFVTSTMGQKSDIDIFFIGTDQLRSIRGREYFEGREFEYFISPEWKYYDRLRMDQVSQRIYSTSLILLDRSQKHNKM